MTRQFFVWMRSVRNLTQPELADKAGVSLSYISKLEIGAKPLNKTIQQRLLRALHLEDGTLDRYLELYHENMATGIYA